jgi:hypothetical protein
MKKIVAVFCLLLCAANLQAKEKPNPADFNIKIHISSTQLAPNPYVLSDSSFPILIVDTELNGKKVKLAGNILLPHHGVHFIKSPFLILSPGDYQIRLKKDESEKDGSIIQQEYELLPNGDTWDCSVVGISE